MRYSAERVRRVVILGSGYVGARLARRLVARGDAVRATTTTEAKLEPLAALGAEVMLFRLDAHEEDFAQAFEDADVIVHLAPPAAGEHPATIAARIKAAAPRVRAFVYGSTTAVFGRHDDPDEWVDESTPTREPTPRGLARLTWERALSDVDLPVRVLRIAGIYGPERTLREGVATQSLVLFHGGPVTSRVHVDDLARLVEVMMDDGAPPLAVACDEEPAPTLDVARYTAELLGVPMPPIVTLEEAKQRLSPIGLEMRLGGHRCRSLVREKLIGKLLHPTYREGVRASLAAEGALP
ncbi:NAD-dependent epimerase/dehydratase family protein [Myxococcota bacterium]|nr:NAD-dependent epimerase/dehydratase family protein [Myxococcota bacterium]